MIDPTTLHRLSHWCLNHRLRGMPRLLMRLNYFLTGCDIAPGVVVGKNVHFQHYGAGVMIHNNVEIGDDVWINPQVVIGQNIRVSGPLPGNTIHIRIGNRVVLGAGAKIIASGHLDIGEDSAVGANAVVLKSVPPRSLAVGVPARIIPIDQPKPDAEK